MIYLCCDERRRTAVADHPTLNGIHFLEVLDRDAPADSPRQQTLLVRLLKPVPPIPADLSTDNVWIEGGERITPVRVAWIAVASAPPAGLVNADEDALLTSLPEADHVLVVRTEESGDYATYTLRIGVTPENPTALSGFDPLLSRVDFSFKVECPSDFDCRPQRLCPEEARDEPDISYLAKDYASFRRLMLDRMAQIMPEWRERNPADLGMTLVELLAYVGDHLSYQQDAIATEAYLATARRRTSIRRHARLVDYHMHDGKNARAFVHVAVSEPAVVLPVRTMVLSRLPGFAIRLDETGSADHPDRDPDRALRQNPVVFETLHAVTVRAGHNRLPFYAWGDQECCLPKGAIRATLQGHVDTLSPGDVLIFEEVLGPGTGRPEDADPGRRHPVRLTEVVSEDAGGDPLTDPLTEAPITEIRWHGDDALPFPLCISARTGPSFGDAFIDEVSVARGNIVLADHGRTITDEDLGTVPAPHLHLAPVPDADRCDPPARVAIPPRFRPTLQERPLTRAVPYDPDQPPASATATRYPPLEAARPVIELSGRFGTTERPWLPQRDLLASAADAREFVAETEVNGSVQLRFGDDRHGERPAAGTAFTATYRVGNGAAGNVGAEALAHVITDQPGILAVRNPLPAAGGTAAETMQQVRERAPYAFRTQQRAVTREDYADKARLHAGVQRAQATFRWTGSWHTVFVTADRLGAAAVDPPFQRDLRRHLEPFRMAGYDLRVDQPRFVSLEIDLFVCVKPDYFRADVKLALLRALGSGRLADGRLGLFHPDNFSFGETVHLSTVIAAAQGVAGVASVEATTFGRQGVPDPLPLAQGRIELGRLEIARLDNDPNYPERGVLRLAMGGGR